MLVNIHDIHAECPFVFVYGTLQMGRGNHAFLQTHKGKSTLITETSTIEHYTLRDCGYPYMIEDDVSPLLVKGELYQINDPDVFSGLDALEGVEGNHYTRKVIPVGGNYEAWAYFVHPSNDVSALPLCGVNEEGCYDWALKYERERAYA